MLRTRLGLTQADVAQLLQTVGRAYYRSIRAPPTLQDEGDQRHLSELLQVDVAEVRSLACGSAAAA
jgi:hypothetical protein